MRVVIDTGVLISAALFEESIPGNVLAYTMAFHIPLVSDELIKEYRRIFSGKKFDSYSPRTTRLALLMEFLDNAEHTLISGALSVCRDPRDNMVIETAVAGSADVLITGDKDILTLRPHPNIEIVTPSEFVARYTR